MVLDTSLLNIQQYKVRIKGKVEQSRERSSAVPLLLGVVAIEKGVFWSPSTTVANNKNNNPNFSNLKTYEKGTGDTEKDRESVNSTILLRSAKLLTSPSEQGWLTGTRASVKATSNYKRW